MILLWFFSIDKLAPYNSGIVLIININSVRVCILLQILQTTMVAPQ